MPTIIRCKACGAKLEFAPGQKICICKYCQSVNTLTIPDNIQLYNNANELRNRCEFDRAIHLYEDMIRMDPEDAESYFGLALCKYGIEYVQDPATGRRIPTCRRLQMIPMSQDEDFRKAIQYADGDVRRAYQAECTKIDKILARAQLLASNGEKFDVFISYKETDDFGSRTEASVIAQDIYQRLTNQGYKVFFSRKTLEAMAGLEYEPVIYCALHSAKVMLLLGTSPEQFEAVWVKNEWSRYIARMNEDPACRLIPVYKDMKPEELPSELRGFQAISMERIGFEQDVMNAVGRVVQKKGSGGDQGITPENIRERGYLEMEQGEYAKAKKFFDQALLHDPEDWNSYFGKLLCNYKKQNMEEILAIVPPIDYRSDGDYKMMKRFANEQQKRQMEEWEKKTQAAVSWQYQALYEEGEKLLAEGNFEGAVNRYTKALKYNPSDFNAHFSRYLGKIGLKSKEEMLELKEMPEKTSDLEKAMGCATDAQRAEIEGIFREIEENMDKQQKEEIAQAWRDVARTPFIFTIIYVVLVTHSGIAGFVMGILKGGVESGNILLFLGVGLIYLIALVIYFIFYFLGPYCFIMGPSIPDTEDDDKKDSDGKKQKEKKTEKPKELPGARKRKIFNLVTGIPMMILCYYLLYLNISDILHFAFP